MVGRKHLLPLLAAALGLGIASAQAEMPEEVTFVITTTAVTTGHSTFSSLQQDPNFWGKLGLNVKTVPVEGSTNAVQQVASGNADFVTIAPEVLLAARERGIPVKAFYAIVPQTIFRVLVPADSDIETPADLKGKTIGIPGTGSASYPFTRTLLSSAGLDPDEDVEWLAIGVGPQAALALERDQVQAIAFWDTMQASLENRGMEFRVIKAPYIDDLIGQVLIAREDTLEEHPEAAIAVAKGIAMATIYALENPEETVRNHWEHYPQSVPSQGTDEEKMTGALTTLKSRIANMAVPDWPATPYGFIPAEKWDATVKVAVDQGLISSPEAVAGAFTNDMIEAINDFSREEAVAPAN